MVVISDSLIASLRPSDRAALNRLLSVMTKTMAQNIFLSGKAWRGVWEENSNLRFVESGKPRDVAEAMRRAGVPNSASIHLFGELPNFELFARELGFKERPITLGADADSIVRDIQRLLKQLMLDLGVPSEMVEREIQDLMEEVRNVLPVLA